MTVKKMDSISSEIILIICHKHDSIINYYVRIINSVEHIKLFLYN